MRFYVLDDSSNPQHKCWQHRARKDLFVKYITLIAALLSGIACAVAILSRIFGCLPPSYSPNTSVPLSQISDYSIYASTIWTCLWLLVCIPTKPYSTNVSPLLRKRYRRAFCALALLCVLVSAIGLIVGFSVPAEPRLVFIGVYII